MSKDRPVIAVHDTQLSRDLSEFDITMIGVGAMIGAGVFVLTGIAAGVAGPALILSFALNGVVTIFTAMVYAELGSAIPEAGGGYLWVKEALGKSNGFLAGWMSWFSHAVAGSLYALGFGSFLGLLLRDFGVELFAPHLLEKVFGVGIALAFLYINFRGASETGLAGNIVTLAKVTVIGLFVLFGLVAILRNPEAFTSFQPFFPQGYGAVFVAMGITFIAFEGYEIIVQAGEEVTDPRRSIPRAIFKSLMIVVPIYVLVGVTAIGAVMLPGTTSWEFLGSHAELGLAEVARRFMPLGTLILLLGGLLSTTSALNATTFSSTRVAFAMGRDRVLPALFSRVHERTKTPHVALAATGALIIFMVLAIPIEDVAAAADVMFLLLFLQVNYAVMRIRSEFGDRLEYGYLMPFYPWVPIIGILTKAFLAVYLYQFSPTAWFSAGAWILVGLGVFVAYSRRRVEEAERTRISYEVKRGERKKTKILVPVAEPDHVPTAMGLATALARGEDAEIIALNVVRIPPQLPLSEGHRYTVEAQPVMEAVAAFAREHEEVTINAIVAVSHQVSQVVIDVASREEVDRIVLGWRGTVHESRLRGSVAQAVVDRSPTDLILVKDRGLPENVGQVLVGMSPGIRAGVVLDVAVDLAKGIGADLRLLTIMSKRTEHTADRLNGWMGEVRGTAIARGLAPGQLVTEVVEVNSESPIEFLIGEAGDSDLLVVGASRNWIFRKYLLGSIPDQIANRARCTTVMVKEQESKVVSLWREVIGWIGLGRGPG